MYSGAQLHYTYLNRCYQCNVNPSVLQNRIAVTNSQHVAAYFGKRHDNVLADIDNLIALDVSCALNFQETYTETPMPKGGTRKDRAFNMTKDGFTLLAFGFTGKKALNFKMQYIQQFNVMEEMLKAPVKEQPVITPSICNSNYKGGHLITPSIWKGRKFPLPFTYT